MITQVCPTCKNSFETLAWRKKHRPSIYCSERCGHLKGKVEGVRLDSRCIECEVAFKYYFREGRAVHKQGRFCSRACFYSHCQKERERRKRAIAKKNAPRDNVCTYAPKAEGYCGCGEEHSNSGFKRP